ncbi:alpha-D-xyloside xylohydrolase [Alteromonadaceae bacterium Bs31]|nr:alpha-D-xyloside xylohydrolase [Alteromonadaceae bacterium Bs31]
MKILLKKTVFTTLIMCFFVASCSQENADESGSATSKNYSKIENGILVAPETGEAKALRLQVYGDNVIRVSASATESIATPESIMVTAQAGGAPFSVSDTDDTVTLATEKMRAEVSLIDGTARFFDKNGELLVSPSNSGSFSTVSKDPDGAKPGSYALQQTFKRNGDEALYGLGQQQNGAVNLAGENLYLTTYNLIITIPYLVSTNNYGILWDNNSDSRFGTPSEPKILAENFTLFDADGKEGGLTARYFDGETLLLERLEKDLDYQFLSNNTNREIPMPEETKDAKNLRIEWLGSISSSVSGNHEFLMYSSGYAKLSIDGVEKLDRWRMNWNPWYHNLKVDMKAGEKRQLKIDWTPQVGYFRLLSHAPSKESAGEQITFSSDTGKAIDYYVVAGENTDQLISGYRKLTGKSVMLPRWAYGFWQSRERYKSQDELLNALKEYRARKIPIDNIVLDWSYWPEDAWGSHDFDAEFFPDPKAMVDEVHENNAQIMISVWPKFYPTTENYKELNAKGYMLNKNIEVGNLDWIGPGYLNAFYDAYNPEARQMYWDQLNKKVNVHGFDAWWLDAVEPDMHSNVSWVQRKEFMSPNHLGNGAEVFNAYAVPHAESVYKNDRASAPDTRVFILTRSGFGGIQRTASAIWSGDTVSRWSNLYEQIAAGINTAMAGVPNWTFDIGGFTPEDRFRSNKGEFVGPYTELDKNELAEWQELNTRWYQFGAFIPLYRAHGQNPYREIYNISEEGSPTYESMVWYTKLRYRLMPYIYSIAGDMYHKDATLMRGLAMDFAHDANALDINDQYMFGPAFLVNPVYEMGARSREVYLPAGSSWYDFYSGKNFQGGQTITAEAPYSRMPLFVKSGSLLVTGPEAQYADATANADLTITVYTGANGEFELYEDDGRSYGYEKGAWTRIPIIYDETSGILSIGARQGAFEGMAEQRSINVRWVSGELAEADNFASNITQSLTYQGSPIAFKKP